jgi:hypothetical protein
LIGNEANLAIFSERALILLEKWVDFDSAILQVELATSTSTNIVGGATIYRPVRSPSAIPKFWSEVGVSFTFPIGLLDTTNA